MWTGTVWMKCICTVMQQHLKLQELLHKSWGFPKVIFLRLCKKILQISVSEVSICDGPLFAGGVLRGGYNGFLRLLWIIVPRHGLFLLRLFLIALEAAVCMYVLHDADAVAVPNSHSVRIAVAFATLASSLYLQTVMCSLNTQLDLPLLPAFAFFSALNRPVNWEEGWSSSI